MLFLPSVSSDQVHGRLQADHLRLRGPTSDVFPISVSAIYQFGFSPLFFSFPPTCYCCLHSVHSFSSDWTRLALIALVNHSCHLFAVRTGASSCGGWRSRCPGPCSSAWPSCTPQSRLTFFGLLLLAFWGFIGRGLWFVVRRRAPIVF